MDSEVGKTESDMRSLLPMSGAASPHKPVLVGDLKIADFKQFLSSKGVQVEFAGGGALRCGEYVTLRKVGPTGQKVIQSKTTAFLTNHFTKALRKLKNDCIFVGSCSGRSIRSTANSDRRTVV